jgi:hypothetical protein
MPTNVRFASEQQEMIYIDVEGDGKQVVSRIATDADKKQYAGAYGEFQQAQSGSGGAASTQAAPQQQTQPGATGAAGQPPSPGANP